VIFNPSPTIHHPSPKQEKADPLLFQTREKSKKQEKKHSSSQQKLAKVKGGEGWVKGNPLPFTPSNPDKQGVSCRKVKGEGYFRL